MRQGKESNVISHVRYACVASSEHYQLLHVSTCVRSSLDARKQQACAAWNRVRVIRLYTRVALGLPTCGVAYPTAYICLHYKPSCILEIKMNIGRNNFSSPSAEGYWEGWREGMPGGSQEEPGRGRRSQDEPGRARFHFAFDVLPLWNSTPVKPY